LGVAPTPSASASMIRHIPGGHGRRREEADSGLSALLIWDVMVRRWCYRGSARGSRPLETHRGGDSLIQHIGANWQPVEPLLPGALDDPRRRHRAR
jgi:hypothetical protein